MNAARGNVRPATLIVVGDIFDACETTDITRRVMTQVLEITAATLWHENRRFQIHRGTAKRANVQ
jgi:hypothetical protein